MIFLLEDDDSIRKLVEYALNSQNLLCTGFALPSEFWEGLKEKRPSLILLELSGVMFQKYMEQFQHCNYGEK